TLAGMDIFGKLVHLRIGEHLQPIFQAPQIHVGSAQLRDDIRWQQPGLSKNSERLEQRSRLQPPVTTTPDQLKRLDDELDLTDPPRAELHVIRQLPPFDFARDQRLHVAQTLKDAEIEIAAIHKRSYR